MARTKKTDSDAKPLYLFVTEERSAGFGYGTSQYFHQYARIVTARQEGNYSSRAPYGADDTYGDGLLYSGLRASCQGDDDSRKRESLDTAVYGVDTEYHDIGSVDLRKVARMAKTLTKIQKGLEKLRTTRGSVRSFGDYLGRLAEIMGCAGFVFEQPARSREMTGERYRWMDVGEGINEANARIWRWQEEGKPKPAPEPVSNTTDCGRCGAAIPDMEAGEGNVSYSHLNSCELYPANTEPANA